MIFGDDGCNALRHEQQGAVVIPLAQERNRFAPESAHFAVRQNGFEAVADFHAIFAVRGNKEDQHAARQLLRSHAPSGREVDRVLLDGFAFERGNGDHRNLRFRFLIDLRAQCR